MSQEAFLRARLELELRQAQDDLTRLEAERLRLARRNELLLSTLYELRGEHVLPDLALQRIEQAIAFDGQPWSEEQDPPGEEQDPPDEAWEADTEADADADQDAAPARPDRT